MIHIAVIGCGHWGMNYLRIFGELPNSKVLLACDADAARLRTVRDRYSFLGTTTELDEVLANKWVDAVVVATPATTHSAIAQQCLRQNKHVLVEKPLTVTVEDSQTLVHLAEQRQRVLMVGHTFLYNSGIRKMRQLVATHELGKVYYLHATRTNMGLIRRDVNAAWDLGAHDVSIFNYLLNAEPERVSAVGAQVLDNELDDVIFATLSYPEGVIANLHVSWVEPNKVREVVVVGSECRVVFNDLHNVEPVRIYEKGVAPANRDTDGFGEFQLMVRDGAIISPQITASEPLKNLANHFLDCVANNKQPLTDGQKGLAVVRTMVAIDQSLAQHGVPVDVQ